MSRLDAYLDDAMDAQEKAAFERELERDESLRMELELQRRADQALERLYAPDADAAPSIPVVSRSASIRRSGGALRVYAIAATLTLAAIGAWFGWSQWQIASSHVYGPTELAKDLDRLYRSHRDAGFEPKWVCRNEEEFIEYSTAQLGRPLLFEEGVEGVTVVGWDRGVPAIGPATQQILVTFDGRDRGAVILIDRLSADREITLPERSKLHLHKRALEDLVLYEISPRDTPTALGLFYEPPFTPATDG